jgi:hypothetical protein
MARPLAPDGAVTMSLPVIGKAEAIHGDVLVPRSAVVAASRRSRVTAGNDDGQASTARATPTPRTSKTHPERGN